MRLEDTLDVGVGGKCGMHSRLVNGNAVVVFEESKILEGWFGLLGKLKGRANDGEDVFGIVFTVTVKRKVVDLIKKRDKVAFVSGAVNSLVMASGEEVEWRAHEDLILPMDGLTQDGLEEHVGWGEREID